MRSTETPMLWVHATINGEKLLCSVNMRREETLEEAMGRGVCYILDAEGGSHATRVWTYTIDEYEFDDRGELMDGQNPGGFGHLAEGSR